MHMIHMQCQKHVLDTCTLDLLIISFNCFNKHFHSNGIKIEIKKNRNKMIHNKSEEKKNFQKP